jgi:hypothetical protein
MTLPVAGAAPHRVRPRMSQGLLDAITEALRSAGASVEIVTAVVWAYGHGSVRRALESVSKLDQAMQSFRSMRRMEASFKNARALRLRFSHSMPAHRVTATSGHSLALGDTLGVTAGGLGGFPLFDA